MTDISVARTEKKYGIDWGRQSVLLRRLEPYMRIDPHGGREGYTVRSLYFDTIYDNDYFDKVNGLELRKKLRLRIYLPDCQAVKLEIKQKQGSAQRKDSLLISRSLAEEMICGRYTGLAAMGSELAMRAYQILETGLYRPKCIVEYHRIALAEESNDIRITFDSRIGASHRWGSFFDRHLELLPVRDQPVLEVKYDGFLLSGIKQALASADAPELSVSKYAMCRQIFGL